MRCRRSDSKEFGVGRVGSLGDDSRWVLDVEDREALFAGESTRGVWILLVTAVDSVSCFVGGAVSVIAGVFSGNSSKLSNLLRGLSMGKLWVLSSSFVHDGVAGA